MWKSVFARIAVSTGLFSEPIIFSCRVADDDHDDDRIAMDMSVILKITMIK